MPLCALALGLTASALGADCRHFQRHAWGLFHPAWIEELKASEAFALTEQLIADPTHRVENEFQVPEYLRTRVLFWLRVHAFYDGNMRVIHDKNDLGIVYGYLDLRPFYAACGRAARTRAVEKDVLRELKARMEEAAGARKTRTMHPAEREALRELLSRAGALGPREVATRLRNLRTQTGQRDEFAAALQRSRELLPHIESVFRRQRLPIALARIPFVESSFNVRAHSKAGAVGIWQLMPRTARQMVKTANRATWRDPLKQTEGAARVLQQYHRELHHWSLAITAYNSGLGRVRRLASKYHPKSLAGLLETKEWRGLGFAGKNFYAQFLSANLAEAYQDQLFHSPYSPADEAVVKREKPPADRSPADELMEVMKKEATGNKGPSDTE